MVPVVSLNSLLLELDASFMYFLLSRLLTNLDSLLICPIVMSRFEFSHVSRKRGTRTTLRLMTEGLTQLYRYYHWAWVPIKSAWLLVLCVLLVEKTFC